MSFTPVDVPSVSNAVSNTTPIDITDSHPISSQGTAADPICIDDSDDDEPIDILSASPFTSESNYSQREPITPPKEKKQEKTGTKQKSSAPPNVPQYLHEELVQAISRRLQAEVASATSQSKSTKKKNRNSRTHPSTQEKMVPSLTRHTTSTVAIAAVTDPPAILSQADQPSESHTPRNSLLGRNVIHSSQSLHQKYKVRCNTGSESSDSDADAKCDVERLRESPKKMLQAERPALMSAKMERNQSKMISSIATNSSAMPPAKVPLKTSKEIEFLPEIISETSRDSTSTTSPLTIENRENRAKHKRVKGNITVLIVHVIIWVGSSSTRQATKSPPTAITNNNKRKSPDEKVEANQVKVRTPYQGVVGCADRYIATIQSRY